MHKKIHMVVVTLFLNLCMVSSLFAATATTAAQDLSRLLNGLHTMQADFVQTIYDSHNKIVQKTTGQMALDRPGKFRWQVKQPIPQLIIANQQRLWIYDPDLEQVTIRSLHNQSGNAPALLLSHQDAGLNRDYEVRSLDKGMPGWTYFQLKPKRADSMFLKVVMGFKNNQIGNMTLVDHLGHSTSIEFINAVFNNNLSNKLFNFTPPKNIDVINEIK